MPCGWESQRPLGTVGSFSKRLVPTETLTHHLTGQSDRQTLAAFGTATGQNLTAVLGCHTSTETVDTGARFRVLGWKVRFMDFYLGESGKA